MWSHSPPAPPPPTTSLRRRPRRLPHPFTSKPSAMQAIMIVYRKAFLVRVLLPCCLGRPL